MVQLRELVAALKDTRDGMFDCYAASDAYVGRLLAEADLNDNQKHLVLKALDTALTDAFYTILLGLDGCTAFGDLEQQCFTILDENGNLISAGNGNLEALASEIFH